MHALCNAFLSHRPTLMSPFSKGLRKNCRFQLWPWHFLGRTGSPLLCPTLCRPKISGSAYFGKSRGNQTWRLSHSVKAYPQFRSSYSHEEMVEHFLLTPAELQLVLTCRGDGNRCGMARLAMSTPHRWVCMATRCCRVFTERITNPRKGLQWPRLIQLWIWRFAYDSTSPELKASSAACFACSLV